MTRSKRPPDSHDNLRKQLSNAVSLRSNEDQSVWTIFATFWATNAILLVALFSTGKLPCNPVIGIVIAAVGMLFALVWWGIQRRALGHLKRFEELMKVIEKKLGYSAKFATSAEINIRGFDENVPCGPSARTLMKYSSIGVSVLWFFTLIYFIVKTIGIPFVLKTIGY